MMDENSSAQLLSRMRILKKSNFLLIEKLPDDYRNFVKNSVELLLAEKLMGLKNFLCLISSD